MNRNKLIAHLQGTFPTDIPNKKGDIFPAGVVTEETSEIASDTIKQIMGEYPRDGIDIISWSTWYQDHRDEEDALVFMSSLLTPEQVQVLRDELYRLYGRYRQVSKTPGYSGLIRICFLEKVLKRIDNRKAWVNYTSENS